MLLNDYFILLSGLTPARRNHRLSRDVTVQSPSALQIHSVSITSGMNKTTSSSQITEVSIHTDPHIHLTNINVNDHNSNEMDVDGAKLDDTKEVLVHSEETTDLERGHRKKRRKKKKRKKIELELKEESD